MRVETPQPLMDWDPFLRQTSVTKKMLPVSLHLGVLGCWLATSCNPDDLCPAVFPLVTKLSCQDTKEIKGEISSGLLFLNWWPAAKFAQINASLVRTVNMLGCEVGLNDRQSCRFHPVVFLNDKQHERETEAKEHSDLLWKGKIS